MIIANMAEANKFANIYQPANSKHPCCSCLVLKDDLNNLSLRSIEYWTPLNMKAALSIANGRDYSIHPEYNVFWNIRYQYHIVLKQLEFVKYIILIS